jgi:excisionase family DNA binding protein
MDILTTTDVATLLGVTDQTVRDLIAKGKLPGERLSDTSWYRVHRDKLIEYAKQRNVTLNWELLEK